MVVGKEKLDAMRLEIRDAIAEINKYVASEKTGPSVEACGSHRTITPNDLDRLKKEIRECVKCGGPMSVQRVKGYKQIEAIVDAFVCTKCGEIVFPHASAKILEKAHSNRESDFVERCANGTAEPEEIDDYVDLWHESDSQLSLPEYLGMTEEEYVFVFLKSSNAADGVRAVIKKRNAS